MNAPRLWCSLLFGLFLLLGPTAYVDSAHGQVPVTGAPESLVLRFDASTSNLNHSAIYAAVAEELHIILADEGSELAATLIVSVTTDGDIQLTYRPARDVVTRTVAVTNTSNVPQRIAQLAGNMVRDQAGSVLAELQPSAPAAPPPPVVQPTTLDPWARGGSAAVEAASAAPTAVGTEPYLADRWISTVFVGGSVTPAATFQFAFHGTKRIDRFEIGLGAQLASAKGRAFATGRRFLHQATFPVSAEVRVVGGVDSYLQVGTSVGLRLTQGWDATVSVDLHATAGFQVGTNHGVVLRAGLGVLPLRFGFSGSSYWDNTAPSLYPSIQLGWQAGWR